MDVNIANSQNEEYTKRYTFPRKAKERTAVNLEKLAVMMEVMDACTNMEDPDSQEESILKKKNVRQKKSNKVLLETKMNEIKKKNSVNNHLSRLDMVHENSSQLEKPYPTKISGLSHFMELEERTDLLSTSPMDDPLGPDSFDNFQWVDVKQEIPDDVEVSKVTLTDLPINVCLENNSESCLKAPLNIDGNAPQRKIIAVQKLKDVEEVVSNETEKAKETYEQDDPQKGGASSEDDQSVNSDWEEKSVLNDSSSEVNECENKNNIIKKKRKNNPQSCDLCGKKLSSKGSLRVHKLKKHKEKNQFICELCGIKFEFHREAVKHRNSVHRQADGRFYCDVCCRRYSDYHGFLTHTKSHLNRNKEDESKKIFPDDSDEKNDFSDDESRIKLKHQEKNFVCHTCGKRFAFNCLLRDHINLHTGTKPYLCQECGKAFSQKATLKQHAKTHNDIRPFQCPDCPSGFYGRGDLKKHIRKHTGERPYICELCGDGFSRSSHLGVHRRSHTGERPYMCDVCGRGFTKRGDVVRHQRIHTGELPYLCQVCGKAFRQSTQCANHIKSQHPDAPVIVARNPNPLYPRISSHLFS